MGIGYQFKTNFIGELQITGKFDEAWDLSVGVRNDDKVLLAIFDRLVNNVEQSEHNKILQNWTFSIEKVQNYTLVWQVVGLAGMFILLFIYRNIQLTKYNKKLEKSNQIIKDKDAALKLLNNTLEDRVTLATKELKQAQSISKIGSWKIIRKNNTMLCSDETYNIFEIDRKSVISVSDSFLSKINIDEVEAVREVCRQHLIDREPYLISYKIHLENGDIKYIQERAESTFDDAGNPIETRGTVQDITEQRLKNIALKEKDQQLFAQSRLAQMGEMISMIAHQWRQPLTAISATTSNLRFKIMLDDIDKDVFEKEIALIDDYSQHLSSTIDDFRGFFKENKIKKLTTLESIVESTLSIVKTSVENKNIIIVKNLTCNAQFKTNVNEVRQVLLNLIKNAEDVLIERDIKQACITIETRCEIDKNMLIVRDNAGGIPIDIKEKIFDPYFSTKRSKDGTGLGLYMSKTIIEDHCGGILHVDNDSEGAVFTIVFDKEITRGEDIDEN